MMKEAYRVGKRKSWNKGKKVNYGWKISKAMKGKMPKNLSEINKNKKGKGNPMFGKTTSILQKEKARKMCLARWGDPEVSLKIRRKMSEKQKGELGSNWKGGVTPLHKKLRRSLDFKLWREAVFKRGNWTCIFCGVRGGILNPDHIKPFAHFPELRFDINNGRTLCVDCHRKTDTYGAKSKKLIYV